MRKQPSSHELYGLCYGNRIENWLGGCRGYVTARHATMLSKTGGFRAALGFICAAGV